MEFCSTRGAHGAVSASQAILSGLSSDCGLYTPRTLPLFSESELSGLTSMDYRGRAAYVLPRFLPDYTSKELEAYVRQAYGARFSDRSIAPLREIDAGMHMLELFHGPTCAFKDFALQLLPQLLTAAAKKCGEERMIAILTATSGDTGKAAMEGFADVPGTCICVFYPDGGTSDIQRLQMNTQTGGNVQVFAVKGNFDDTQNGVKHIFTDAEAIAALGKSRIMLSSANSINWGRLAPQTAYYFHAYAELVAAGKIKLGDKINFCVPTGNFGNILAGYFAKRSGLPIDKLICASNRNNVLTEFIRTGVYDKNREFYLTSSPSMDILISSNLERLLFELSGHDCERVCGLMKQLGEDGCYDIGREMLDRLREEGFCAYFSDETATERCIKNIWDQHGYLCDTHTAVAADSYRQYREETGDGSPTVVLSTASPFKFAPAILSALGAPREADDFSAIEALEKLTGLSAPPQLKNICGMPERFGGSAIGREDMKARVLEWLVKA
ncbi:MAG: threonine synthase [Clostridia bacterium]|nr:threonine synthase [Clostridia bacterium]